MGLSYKTSDDCHVKQGCTLRSSLRAKCYMLKKNCKVESTSERIPIRQPDFVEGSGTAGAG